MADCSRQQIVILTTVLVAEKLGDTGNEYKKNAQILYEEV
jgi:hypothetical protein